MIQQVIPFKHNLADFTIIYFKASYYHTIFIIPSSVGFGSYLERYGHEIQEIVDSQRTSPDYLGPETRKIVDTLNQLIPLDQLEERRRKRDERMANLAKLKREMDAKDDKDTE